MGENRKMKVAGIKKFVIMSILVVMIVNLCGCENNKMVQVEITKENFRDFFYFYQVSDEPRVTNFLRDIKVTKRIHQTVNAAYQLNRAGLKIEDEGVCVTVHYKDCDVYIDSPDYKYEVQEGNAIETFYLGPDSFKYNSLSDSYHRVPLEYFTISVYYSSYFDYRYSVFNPVLEPEILDARGYIYVSKEYLKYLESKKES